MAEPKVLTIHISLDESAPEIWRRFAISSGMTLGQLHDTIQIVMGWTDSHLHCFEIKGERYTRMHPDIIDDFGDEDLDEDAVVLGDILKRKGQQFSYVYDYGDYWEHDLKVEATGAPTPGQHYPVCLGGERACPIEDSGGLGGYYHKLQVLRDPNDRNYASFREWVGEDFDPDHLDVDEVNAELESMAKNLVRFRPLR